MFLATLRTTPSPASPLPQIVIFLQTFGTQGKTARACPGKSWIGMTGNTGWKLFSHPTTGWLTGNGTLCLIHAIPRGCAALAASRLI